MRKFPIITIVGGGSNYSAEVLRLLIKQWKTLGLREIRLMDNDQSRFEDSGMSRMEINAALARRMVSAQHAEVTISVHYSLSSAIAGTSLVLTQIRPGMNRERIRLELLARKFGCIGQETNGLGGIALEVLSIKAIIEVARVMEKLAPEASLINFTNPAGMVAQALVNYTKVNAFGMCNIPICFLLDGLAGLGFDVEVIDQVRVNWYGLNHFSFLQHFDIYGVDHIAKVAHHFETLAEDEWGDLGVADKTIAWMREFGIVPGHYLPYYLFTDAVRGFQNAQPCTRGQEIAEQEPLLFRDLMDPELVTTPDRLRNRGGTNYSKAALRAIRGLQGDQPVYQILCCRNNGAMANLGDDVAVEVPTWVTENGVQPIPQPVDERVASMICDRADMQELVVKAAMERDPRLLVQALVVDPLTPSDQTTCEQMVAELFSGDDQHLFDDWK